MGNIQQKRVDSHIDSLDLKGDLSGVLELIYSEVDNVKDRVEDIV